MSKVKITGKLALQLLEEVVAEKGADYLYPHTVCAYALEGQPACIAGHVFAKAGAPVSELTNTEGTVDTLEVWDESGEHPPSFSMTPAAERILLAAQKAQDGTEGGMESRKTWGEALEEARRVK